MLIWQPHLTVLTSQKHSVWNCVMNKLSLVKGVKCSPLDTLTYTRVHLPVTYFLFRDTTFHLVLALSASLRPKYGTPYLLTFANPKHTLPSDVILRRTTFSQPILPPSGPCNTPWFSSETLALYNLNLLLTYLYHGTRWTSLLFPWQAVSDHLQHFGR